jgi:pimeloyl-ACP methyl ester carboxylesterase
MGPIPDPIAATAGDLPPEVAAALAEPPEPRFSTTPAAGYEFRARSWGDATGRPLLLIHGVTSSGDTWWRIGPALAASGRWVVAPDSPGHGETGGWQGRHRFEQTATDLVAFAEAAGLATPRLQVIGHSWGGLVSAALPAAGLRPERLVLLDPPALPNAFWRRYVEQPDERRYPSLEAALPEVRSLYPSWSERDVLAKAEGLTRFDEAAVRSIMLETGDWDAGLAALDDPRARDIPVWYVKGEEAAGSLLPDAWLPRLADRAGAGHILTIRDGEHSPQRQRAEATVFALLRALGD